MSTTTGTTPQGPVPAIGIPDSQDYPRLVYTAPYFQTVPLAELIEPSVLEAVEAALPALVPPYVDAAADAAVNARAVLLTGSTMSGPLYLAPTIPTQPSQAASMAYVDLMVSTAGVPEVPVVPSGQTWARQTGQWVPIDDSGTTFLPLSGGTMAGQINMSGNAITNLPALPVMPNGAAPATWVLNQIAAQSLYQGTWNLDTYTPDLTQGVNQQNSFTWIAVTTSLSGVVVTPAIPGLQGQTVFNGDTIIWSAIAGQFQRIHSGGLTLDEANALFLQLAGGQMSGSLLLHANATQPTEAVTLQQMNTAVAGAGIGEAPPTGQLYGRNGQSNFWSPVLPLAGGTMTGALTLSGNVAGALNAVPLQQLQSTVSAAVAPMVPLAGGTMSGPLVLSGNAATALGAVPLQQVSGMLAGYAPLLSPAFTGTPTAVTQAAGNSTTALATTAFVGTALAGAENNVGRNLIHNSMFFVYQRGTGPFTTNGAYTLDRWQLSLALDTASITQSAANDSNRAQIGDEAFKYSLLNVFTGNAGATAYNRILQRIENVRKLAGKTITVSFAAAAAAGTPRLGIGMVQSFGTGGSPSAAVVVNGQSVTLGTTYTRYSVTFTLPSSSGKVLGTNGDDYTELSFWFSSGTTNATAAGSVGVQSGSIGIWGVQLEVGTIMTPLEKIDIALDIVRCQRFYQTGIMQRNFTSGGVMTDTIIMPFPVVFRITPTMGGNFSTQTGGTGSLNPQSALAYQFLVAISATSGNQVNVYCSWTASADL